MRVSFWLNFKRIRNTIENIFYSFLNHSIMMTQWENKPWERNNMFSLDRFRALMHEMGEHYAIGSVRVIKKKQGYLTTKLSKAPSLEVCTNMMNRVCNLAGCFNEVKRVKPDSITFAISYWRWADQESCWIHDILHQKSWLLSYTQNFERLKWEKHFLLVSDPANNVSSQSFSSSRKQSTVRYAGGNVRLGWNRQDSILT